MKKISDAWRSLPKRQRDKYEILASKEKERYLKDTIIFHKEFKRLFPANDI